MVSFFFTPGYHKSTLFEGNVQKYIHKCLLFQKYEYLYGVHRDGHYNLIDKKAFSWFCISEKSKFPSAFNLDGFAYRAQAWSHNHDTDE